MKKKYIILYTMRMKDSYHSSKNAKEDSIMLELTEDDFTTTLFKIIDKITSYWDDIYKKGGRENLMQCDIIKNITQLNF